MQICLLLNLRVCLCFACDCCVFGASFLPLLDFGRFPMTRSVRSIKMGQFLLFSHDKKRKKRISLRGQKDQFLLWHDIRFLRFLSWENNKNRVILLLLTLLVVGKGLEQDFGQIEALSRWLSHASGKHTSPQRLLSPTQGSR